MKKIILIGWVLITIAFGAMAQVHKKFFNKNGKETKDSTKAVAYLLYQKEGPDSLWSTVKLDMRGIPIEKGLYLDDDLTIRHGKFVYYQIALNQNKIDDHHSSIDTLIKVKETG